MNGWWRPRTTGVKSVAIIAGAMAAGRRLTRLLPHAAILAARRGPQDRREAAAAAAAPPGPLPVPDPAAAAFFDVDNTMMRGASIYYFARGLAARKLFTMRDLAMFACGAGPVPDARHRELRAHRQRQGGRARVRRLPEGRQHRQAQRGDLRRGDGGPHLARHPHPRPPAPGRLPAGVARHRHARRGRPDDRAPPRPHRRTRHRRRDPRGLYTGRLVGNLLHGPAKAEAVRALANREASTSPAAPPTATPSTTCRC